MTFENESAGSVIAAIGAARDYVQGHYKSFEVCLRDIDFFLAAVDHADFPSADIYALKGLLVDWMQSSAPQTSKGRPALPPTKRLIYETLIEQLTATGTALSVAREQASEAIGVSSERDAARKRSKAGIKSS